MTLSESLHPIISLVLGVSPSEFSPKVSSSQHSHKGTMSDVRLSLQRTLLWIYFRFYSTGPPKSNMGESNERTSITRLPRLENDKVRYKVFVLPKERTRKVEIPKGLGNKMSVKVM